MNHYTIILGIVTLFTYVNSSPSKAASPKHLSTPVLTATYHNNPIIVQDTTTHRYNAKVGKYFCAMGCEGDKMYDKPGKCPKCGMALRQWKKTTNRDHQHQKGRK